MTEPEHEEPITVRQLLRDRSARWDQPLSARQLVTIVLVIGVTVLLILSAIRSVNSVNHASQAVDCSLRAPVGWDCSRFPTGYPQP